MDDITNEVIKLLLAMVVGGLIGAEREIREKAAGFRTMMLICVGSALFTIFSHRLADGGDPNRIAAQIVSGIGFLGAGVILREGTRIRGLTTAATIWMVAALGVGIGGGFIFYSLIATGMILLVLAVFPSFESWMERIRETRSYEITFTKDFQKLKELEDMFSQNKLRINAHKNLKSGEYFVSTWTLVGPPDQHEKILETLLQDPDVKSFNY